MSWNQLTGDVPFFFSGQLTDFSGGGSGAWLNNNWLQITPGTQSRLNIDQMVSAGKIVEFTPQNGITPALLRLSLFTANVSQNDSIDASIVPTVNQNYLSGASPLGMGVVADDVTPVLLQFSGTPTNYTLQITNNATSYNGSLANHLFVLQNGAWTPSTSLTISSSSTPAYAYLSWGLTWTDFYRDPCQWCDGDSRTAKCESRQRGYSSCQHEFFGCSPADYPRAWLQCRRNLLVHGFYKHFTIRKCQ